MRGSRTFLSVKVRSSELEAEKVLKPTNLKINGISRTESIEKIKEQLREAHHETVPIVLGGDNAGRWNTEIFSLVQLISVEPMPPLTSNGYSFYDVFLRVENYGNGDSYWLWRSVDIPDANRID